MANDQEEEYYGYYYNEEEDKGLLDPAWERQQTKVPCLTVGTGLISKDTLSVVRNNRHYNIVLIPSIPYCT